MNTFYPQKYPVFEADQVLSQHHLNQIITYLDNQDRLTRNGAIGIGIICGMQFSFPNATSLHISCGQAITSLGYMMDVEATTYTHFHDVVLPDTFLKPDLSVELYLKDILDLSAPYSAIKNCTELLTSTSEASDKKLIPSGFFEDKVIIQLLQVDFIDQKNCLALNCDDKGKRMEFNLRTLLISEAQAEKLGVTENPLLTFPSRIDLPRFNVPHKNLFGAVSVLNEFKKRFDQNIIQKISGSVKNIYTIYQNELLPNSSFQALNNISTTINNQWIAHQNTLNVQYLWEWLQDIADAYNEIIYLQSPPKPKCCVQASLFPFHIVIGSKQVDVRTPFYPAQDEGQAYATFKTQLTTLFQRLLTIVQQWNIDNQGVRITPSCYGRHDLSEKAIPFYYGNIAAMQKCWNAQKSLTNRMAEIPAYHLNANHAILRNELERYNFFRIEGHVGKPYKNAIQQIELLRKTYDLPFQVTALNAADSRNKVMDLANFKGRWDDLETDYDIARKRIFNITEFVVKWIDKHKDAIISQTLMSNATITQLKKILSDIRETLPVDLMEFLPDHDDFIKLFKNLNEIFLFHRFCIQLNKNDLSLLAEDLIDRFDDINNLFLEDPLTVIHDEALLRWKSVYQDLFFSTFIQKHTGVEPQGGVVRGGTFVVVYLDNTVFKKAQRPKIFTGILATVASYKNSLSFTNEVQQEVNLALSTQFQSGVTATPIVVSNPCKEEVDKAKTNLLEITAKNLGANFTTDVHAMLVDQLHFAFDIGAQVGANDGGFEGMVIADFFIPTICCGDGHTIEIHMDTPESVTIDMEKKAFCTNDNKLYEILINGQLGGTFTGTLKDAIVLQNNKFLFKPNHPSIALVNNYTLQYSVDGIVSNLLTLSIEAPAVLSWQAKSSRTNPNEVVFFNKQMVEGQEFEFNFGDNSPKEKINQNQVSHNYSLSPAGQTFTVTITQLNTVCESKQVLTVNIAVVQSPKDFNKNDFNNKDFNA